MVYILRNVATGETAVLGVSGSYTLGRSEMNNILLRNKYCTRKHAIIEIKDGFATISDVGSKRGISVNKVKIQDKTKLQNGDIILFGLKDCVYKFIDPQFYTVIDKTVSQDTKRAVQEALKELDVTLLDNYSQECSYYVTETISLDTLKHSRLFDAVVDQKPVVKPNFWIDMFKNIKEGDPIPNKYRYTPKIQESLRNKGLQYIVPKLNRKQLFIEKLCIFFDPGLEKRLEHLVWKCGGGTIQHNEKPDFATTLTEGMDFLEAIIVTEQRIENLPLTVTYFIDKLRQCHKTVRQMSEEDVCIAVLKGYMEKMSLIEQEAKQKAAENEIAIFSDSSDEDVTVDLLKPTTSKKSNIKDIKKKSLKPNYTTLSPWIWRTKISKTTSNTGRSKDLDTGSNKSSVDEQNKDQDKNVHKSKDELKDKEKYKSKNNKVNESKFDTSLSMSSSSDEETNIKEKKFSKNPQKSSVRINIDDSEPTTSKEKQKKLPEKENGCHENSQERSVCFLELPDSPIRIINVDSDSEEMPFSQIKTPEKALEKKNGQHSNDKHEPISVADSPDHFQRKTKQRQPASCILDDSEELFRSVCKKVKKDSDSDDTTLSLEDEPQAQRKKLKLNPFANTTCSSTPKSKSKCTPNIQQLNQMFTDVDFLPI